MSHDWILEVLEDIRLYAGRNGLEVLAAQLETTIRIARADLRIGAGGTELADVIDIDAERLRREASRGGDVDPE